MSAPSSLHRTGEPSKSQSQVRGRPAILLDAAPISDADGSEPFSPSLLFNTRDVNAMSMGGKSLPTSKTTSAHRANPAAGAMGSRAGSAFSSTSLSHRPPLATAATTATATKPSLPTFASSLGSSAMHGSLSCPSHPFHRDDDEDSQLLLMKENTNLEMPRAEDDEDDIARGDTEGSPTTDLQRDVSSWSRSGPVSRNASPPPRPAELATDFPLYEDSLSSVGIRAAGQNVSPPPTAPTQAPAHKAHDEHVETVAVKPVVNGVKEDAEDASSQYASPTPPPRRAVVLTAAAAAIASSAASSFAMAGDEEMSATVPVPLPPRGSTMLVSAVQSDALTSLFRLQRRATEAVVEVATVTATTVEAEKEEEEISPSTRAAILEVESTSLVLATAEQMDATRGHINNTGINKHVPAASATAGDDSLETRLYPLHTGQTPDATTAEEEIDDMSPLPRPLRPSQRAAAPSTDPLLSAATAEAVRDAREKRAAALSATRITDTKSDSPRQDDHDDEDVSKVLKDATNTPSLTATARPTTETAKSSLQLVTGASSVVWPAESQPLHATRHHGGKAVDPESARPSYPASATRDSPEPIAKPSTAMSGQWIDSRDFHMSEPALAPTTATADEEEEDAAPGSVSASPAPVRPNEAMTTTCEACEPAIENEEEEEMEEREQQQQQQDPTALVDTATRVISAGASDSPAPASISEPMRRSLSALDTPSHRISHEVRELMQKAQEQIRRTRESLLATIEKDMQSLQRASGTPTTDDSSSRLDASTATETNTDTSASHTSSAMNASRRDQNDSATTTLTTVSLSPLTPEAPRGRHSRQEEGLPEPSRALEFVPMSPGATPKASRLSGTRRGFAWPIAELRVELSAIADAVLHRLQGYDRQRHGVLPMEVVLRVTYFVIQQRHPSRLSGLSETPARGGALLLAAAATGATSTTPRASYTLRTPLATRMSGHLLPYRHSAVSGVKRTTRCSDDPVPATVITTAASDAEANKENVAPGQTLVRGSEGDVWWPSPAVKRPRTELCLRETGDPEPGEAVPYPRGLSNRKQQEDEEDVEEQEVVGRPATRISPSRTLELLAASQARRAEEDVCMDLYTSLLAAFREVFGERYAWQHLGATNATRHDAFYSHHRLSNDAESNGARRQSLDSGRRSPKKRVLQDLNEVPPPLETAFPRLRQQYAIHTRKADGSAHHVCDPRHPPPLDMLVYYNVFVDSLRELGDA